LNGPAETPIEETSKPQKNIHRICIKIHFPLRKTFSTRFRLAQRNLKLALITQFFYRLNNITAPFSGGKGKPRYIAKRLQNKQHTQKPLAFNSDHLTPEAKENLCELEEEQKFQDYLAKEAAAKAALAGEQTKVFYQLPNL
jgi:hypothetical protein